MGKAALLTYFSLVSYTTAYLIFIIVLKVSTVTVSLCSLASYLSFMARMF